MKISLKDYHVNGIVMQMVDARTLHGYLWVRRPFRLWVEDFIRKSFLKEGEDYVASGSKIKNYDASLEVAKNLCMYKPNSLEQAKIVKARLIEIQGEFEYQAKSGAFDPNSLLLMLEQRIAVLENQVTSLSAGLIRIAEKNTVAVQKKQVKQTTSSVKRKPRPKKKVVFFDQTNISNAYSLNAVIESNELDKSTALKFLYKKGILNADYSPNKHYLSNSLFACYDKGILNKKGAQYIADHTDEIIQLEFASLGMKMPDIPAEDAIHG